MDSRGPNVQQPTMNFKKLLTEDRAVSPVIGVILMVAITVILAAVIGTFVLGLGDQVSESAPQAQFTFDNSSSGVVVTHDGGDAIDSDLLTFSGAGAAGDGTNGPTGSWTDFDDAAASTVSAGDSVTVVDENNGDAALSGGTLRVVWSSSNSDKTATIGQFEV